MREKTDGGVMQTDLEELTKKKFVVGTNQTLKHIKNGNIEKVFIACDAYDKVVCDIKKGCEEYKIPVVYVETMKELGNYCAISRPAACAAIISF